MRSRCDSSAVLKFKFLFRVLTAMASQEGLSSKDLPHEPSADPQVLAIAQQFLLQYYQIFDTNRPSLGALYVSILYIYIYNIYI